MTAQSNQARNNGPLNNRIEFVYFFDVTRGNPNGDPDMGNMPRMDPMTQRGLVTDVCLKRRVRNYVEIVKEGAAGYDIYVREKAILNNQHKRAYEAKGLTAEKGKLPKQDSDARAVTAWMCETFFDIRSFGAVMTTGVNCGQVRGPVQLTFAQSLEPLQALPVTITRMAVTTEAEAEKQQGDNRTVGEKWIVPYGLYRTHGFISPHLARRSGFSEDDLTLFWQALINMFDHDRSAARGEMAARRLLVFRHDSSLGNAPAHALFDLVGTRKKAENGQPARGFSDYEITLDEERLPTGVTWEALL
ncbi:type I-C CRISPR-associated protein Cas7/Csd2 [Algihabitans albus]|uniref:type I-C CRISPR-associated protein Cas7/Csd2 n=1 Tax=Algihabitans albus TaxID=2164067 RepID=UPI0035CF398A